MRALAFAIVLGLAAAPALAETPTAGQIRAMTADSQKFAQAALGTLEKLVTKATAQRMGFDTPSQVLGARLGAPFADYMIGLESLRDYRPGQNPDMLIEATGELHFPVVAAGTTRCLITLVPREGGWRALSFGAPVLSRALASARDRGGIAASEGFVLRIPAFNLTFLAYRQDGRLMAIAAQTGGLYGIEDGSIA